MTREDFKDNEYIDKLVEELNATGANVMVGKMDTLSTGVVQIHFGLCVSELPAALSSL